MISPNQRKELFNTSEVIVATPQTIANDTKNKLISLEDVSLLVIDECHRSKQRFANTIVSSSYKQEAKHPRILALTASPGATREKIEEICKNLHIEGVEIRTEEDEDIKPYLQKKEIQHIKVDLTPEIKQLQEPIKKMYLEKLSVLKGFGLSKPINIVNKRDLLLMQKRYQAELGRGNRAAFSALSLLAQAIKISYMLELIETQSLHSFNTYMKKIEQETSKAAKTIVSDKRVIEVRKKSEGGNILHPKMLKIKELVSSELEQNKEARIIIFANYRTAVDEINKLLSAIPGARPTILVGQKLGFSQKEQMEIIEKFNNNVYNILIGTSITEEGLSIGSLDTAIFYDHTGSEIRKIQRSGRVGRIKSGKIINIIAKGTRDEALLWTSHRKEKKMQNLLGFMKQKLEKQQRL